MTTTAKAAAATAAGLALRAWALRWGASGEEAHEALPGDRLLEHPSLETTRAITIAAPPSKVWPWLVQMGQDRAGLYSYDGLERLFRLDFHNADALVPEWQHLEVGDQIRAAPERAGPGAGFTVVEVVPERVLVTVAGDPERVLPEVATGRLRDGATWTFVLRPRDGGRHTRLLVRLRARFGMSAVPEWLSARALEPVHFVMERKQLLGIEARAEQVA